MRKNLIELIRSSLMKYVGKSCKLAENIADDLLQNGVMALPCIVENFIEHSNYYYLTQEEAEKALERRDYE